jgi:hypothetical protein
MPENNYQEQLRNAMEALEILRDEGISVDERKLRLSELKERFRLLGLYDRAKKEETAAAAEDTESAELLEIREHLEPLDLAPEGTPTAELARLAALKIMQL